MAALDYLAVAIRNNHESGNIGMLHNPLAILAVFLDRLGRYEPAATIAGFAAVNPMVAAALPELGAGDQPTSARSSATRPTNRSPARERR